MSNEDMVPLKHWESLAHVSVERDDVPLQLWNEISLDIFQKTLWRSLNVLHDWIGIKKSFKETPKYEN